MKSAVKVILAAISTIAFNAHAVTISPARVIEGLKFNVKSNYYQDCSNLFLDLNGSNTSSIFSASGALNCNSGGLVVNGSGYFDNAGGLALEFSISTNKFICTLIPPTFNGKCKVLSTSTLQLVEQATLTYTP